MMDRAAAARRRALRFYALYGVLALVMIGMSAFWWVQSRAAARAPTAIVEALRGAGWTVALGPSRVAGFPNRLDVTLAGATVEAPGGVWRWRVDALLTRAVIYDDSRVFLSAEGPHRLDTPRGALTIVAPEAQASLAFDGAALDRLALDAPALSLEGPSGTLRIARARLHLRRAPGRPAGSYEVVIRLDGVEGDGLEPISAVRVDAEATTDPPIARGPARLDPTPRLALAPSDRDRLERVLTAVGLQTPRDE